MGLKFGQTEKFMSIFRFAAVRYFIFNPLTVRIFTVFGHLGRMGRDAPRYPHHDPEP